MLLRLVYKDDRLGEAWRRHFSSAGPMVELIKGDVCEVSCDAIVSPANSFGFMDGGLDLALSRRFGWELQERLQAEIGRRPMRELLVGEAIVVPTGDAKVPWLIAAPTMRVPMRLRQTINAYLSMKAVLVSAGAHTLKPGIDSIAVPGLGTGCGAVPAETAAFQMWQAYKETALNDFVYPRSFGEAQARHVAMNQDEIDLWNQ